VCADNNSIYLVDNTGILRNTLTGYGFNVPTGTLKVGSTLYVSDTLNNRIVSLPQTGPYTYGTMSSVTTMTKPYGITSDLDGNYYVALSDTNSYSIYNNAWNLQTTCTKSTLLNGAFGIVVDETGAVYVAGQRSNTVVKMQASFSQPPPFNQNPT